MSLGPVMFDLAGTELTSEEIALLQHPAAGGIILFTRNYRTPLQLRELVRAIRSHRPSLLIAIDQEGGRVQRFQRQFTRLPALRKWGAIYDQDPQSAKIYVETAGWIMASELRQYDIDFSFAPVLDIDFDHNEVIGDRAFHADPHVVAELASYFIQGMHRAGMKAVGKHFPGHGFVSTDSHEELPYDLRSLEQLQKKDLVPFQRLIQMHLLTGVMPAHIVYQKIDKLPASFSRYWINQVLRHEMGFKGVVFSDSLTMEGAESMGGFDERAKKALSAGCDMVLVCNHRLATWTVLETAKSFISEAHATVLSSMRGQGEQGMMELALDPAWREGVALLSQVTSNK